jgi:hypothetical protein
VSALKNSEHDQNTEQEQCSLLLLPATDWGEGTREKRSRLLINLPLIYILLPDFFHSNLGPQLHEPNPSKRFGEDVRELSPGVDVLESNLSAINAVPYEVKSGVNVLTAVVEDGILR